MVIRWNENIAGQARAHAVTYAFQQYVSDRLVPVVATGVATITFGTPLRAGITYGTPVLAGITFATGKQAHIIFGTGVPS